MLTCGSRGDPVSLKPGRGQAEPHERNRPCQCERAHRQAEVRLRVADLDVRRMKRKQDRSADSKAGCDGQVTETIPPGTRTSVVFQVKLDVPGSPDHRCRTG